MYPLDFEEFCWTFGEEQLIEYIKDCFQNKKPLVQSQHKKAMLLFRQFMLVGGMPQSIVAFLENDRDFYAADKRKRGILNLYREDIMKIKKAWIEAITEKERKGLKDKTRRIPVSPNLKRLLPLIDVEAIKKLNKDTISRHERLY